MTPRTLRLLIALNLLACVVLALLWLRALDDNRTLEKNLRLAREARESAIAKNDSLRQRLSERASLIEKRRSEIAESSRSAERQRHLATFQFIEQLKADPAIRDRPPLPKRPPRTPHVNFSAGGPYGDIFPELLYDPEYSSLCLIGLEDQQRLHQSRHLHAIGADAKTREKVIRLWAESALLDMDFRALVGEDAAQKSEAAATLQKQKQAIEAEVRSTLGEENYARLQTAREDYDRLFSSRGHLESLATRLSYSSSPLTTEKIDQLTTILSSLPGNRSVLSDAFLEATRSTLTPDQHAALLQLQTEKLAKDKRAKLPKSSEVPRL